MSLQVVEKFRHLVSHTPEFQALVGAATPAAAAERIDAWLEDIEPGRPLPILSAYPGATDWTKKAEPGYYQESGVIEFKFFLPPPAGGDDGGDEFQAVRNQVTGVIAGILKLTGTANYMDMETISIGDQTKSARDRAERFWVIEGSAEWGVAF